MGQESAGIGPESTGMTLFLQEWNILNKIAYIYIFAYISISVFIDLLLVI